jgi:hypothetical protein
MGLAQPLPFLSLLSPISVLSITQKRVQCPWICLLATPPVAKRKSKKGRNEGMQKADPIIQMVTEGGELDSKKKLRME